MKKPSLKERVGATLTPAEIKRAWDALSEKSSRLTDRFIAEGRGHERPSEYLQEDRTDALSREAREIYAQKTALEVEAHKYAGPYWRQVVNLGAAWSRKR